MVKSIVIDDGANKLLENVLDKAESSTKTGLIIGALGESKDYIIYIVPTPESENKSEKLDQDWIVNHGLQIHDMLIGGMDILGIYCVDQTAAIAKQILLSLFRTLSENLDYYKKMNFNTDRLLFLVDSTTKKINMKSLDYTNDKSTLQTCQIDSKNDLFDKEFFQLNSNLDINTTFKTANVKSYNLRKEDLYKSLSFADFLNNQKYICLIDDCFIDEKISFTEYLNSNKANQVSKEYQVTLMENLAVKSKSDAKLGTSCLESIYQLNGVCNLTVSFHKSMTIEHLKRLLVYDLMKSFYARVRLLVEDLDARKDIIGDDQLDDPDSEESSAIEESYQTPNRIHICMQRDSKKKKADGSTFLICDYVFPDETSLDISERIKQLFNYEIKEAQIVYVENLPPEIKRNQDEMDGLSDDGSNNLSRPDCNISSRNSNRINLLENTKIILGAVAAGLIATAVYFMTFKSNEDSNK